MSVINFFDFSLNVLISSVSFKSYTKDSYRLILELLNQLFDRLFAISVLLLDCTMRYSWHSIVTVAATGFTVTSRYGLVVRGFSCFLLKLILLSTLRVRLQINSRQPWRLENFVEKLIRSLHAYHFLNTYRRLCVLESDCVGSCLIKLQSFLLSELKIEPIHCILMRSPRYFLRCDPWLVQVASNFFHALIVVHRVHCSDEHGLSVPFETSSSWDQSTSDN